MIVRWVIALVPSDFGLARSRWTWEAVAIVLREDHCVRVSRETVRRRLRGRGLVWRRPRPVVRRRDPERAAEQEALSNLMAGALGSYKNSHSHRHFTIKDASEAAEMVIFASHLLRIIDTRRPP